MGSRHRPGTAPGPADDRPSTLRARTGDPTLITHLKVRTRAKSITGFSLSKPVPGFKTGYRFSGSRLTSLVTLGPLYRFGPLGCQWLVTPLLPWQCPWKNQKTNFRMIIDSHSSTNPKNQPKIGPIGIKSFSKIYKNK